MKKIATKQTDRKVRVKKAAAKPAKASAPIEPAPPKKVEVKITAAKGRPMLTWVGKRPLSYVTAFPAQHVEAFDPTYWMLCSRHTKVEGLTETRSALVDSWTVQVPITEPQGLQMPPTTEVRVKMFQLPVQAWVALSREKIRKKLYVFEDHLVSYCSASGRFPL